MSAEIAVGAIFAVGMLLLLVSGRIDLSVGAVASVTGALVGYLITSGWSQPAAIFAGIAAASVCGLLNGLLVVKLRAHALLVTVGTAFVFAGLSTILGRHKADILNPSAAIWAAPAVGILVHIFLGRPRFLRQLYYVGSNPRAAFLCGMNVDGLQLLAFTLSGMLAGIAGVLAPVSQFELGREVAAIAGCLIGGASLSGGRGRVPGVIAGAAIVAIILNISGPEWRNVGLGLLLILAVTLDRKRS